MSFAQIILFTDTVTLQRHTVYTHKEIYYQALSASLDKIERVILLNYTDGRLVFRNKDGIIEIPKSELGGVWIRSKQNKYYVKPAKWFKIYGPNCKIEKF